MNRNASQRNGVVACGEMRGCISVSDPMNSVVCPKPRRHGLLNPAINDHIRPLRCHVTHQTDICDSKAGAELLDIILRKGSYGGEQSGSVVASLPPFFSGSPPSRVSNPVIQDAQFSNEKLPQLSPEPASAHKVGGCARMKFGHMPAAVRIEGFDCLSRDRCNCSISAVA